MKNQYSHFLLYAKRHYKKSILVEDLKKITGAYLNCDAEYVTVPDIVSILIKACWFYGIASNESKFVDLLSDLHPQNTFRVGYHHNESHFHDEMFDAKYDFNTALIYKCLSFLSLLQVYESKTGKVLIELDETDNTILPRHV